MSTVNKVILIGNLGADPELRYTGSGKAVAEMRMATSSKFGDEEETEWHRVIVWEKAAENVAKYLTKGSKAYVEGRIKTRQYEDKDGNTRYITEVVASQVTFLDSKGADKPEPGPASKSQQKRVASQKRTEDYCIPF